ncbi:glycoside hydrolase family 32 protein [Psychromicrobium xiongbiense]|uniref:glycoside hydrolase family 32 protein n=1 Tax=Psychromicrobium xiongbiense TaxID=3051184 RepID=UPI002552C325|nr:glycoside hydrolase family 32 protein [Psychromicrobium sp. YIM S02556]
MTELIHPLATVPRGELVARADADPHRPRFHFVSPAGWLNDPNGVGQWDGVYHLFYQYNPEGAFHHRILWGHAVSTDLVTWQDAPVALEPGDGPEDPDRDGCWSGVLVNDSGVPTLVYSGRHDGHELPCVAVGSPDLLNWNKAPENPVIAAPPAGVDITAYRDHCVWREGSRWRQLVGSGVRGQGGTAFLYESEDLRSWDYLGPLFVGDATDRPQDATDWTGTMWECVDLFRAGSGELGSAGGPGEDVLVFSAWDEGRTHHPLYWTGRYNGDSFEPMDLQRLDYGGRYFYAPQSFRDESGRRIMFGWLQEGRSDAAAQEAGWSGVMSLPRLTTLAADGTLSFEPVPELKRLRSGHRTLPSRVLVGPEADTPGWSIDAPVLVGVSGVQLDLEVELQLSPGSAVRLGLLGTRDERGTVLEETAVELSLPEEGGVGHLRLDRSLSNSSGEPGLDLDTGVKEGPVPMAGGRVSLRVLVDRSAIEVFANGRPLTARVYPAFDDGQLSLGATAGTARLLALDAWTMDDIFTSERQLRPGGRAGSGRLAHPTSTTSTDESTMTTKAGVA